MKLFQLSDKSTASCSGGSFNQRTCCTIGCYCSEAAETICTSFLGPLLSDNSSVEQTARVRGQQRVKEQRTGGRVGDKAASPADAEEAPNRRKRQIFLICSLSCCAPSELHDGDSPAITHDWLTDRVAAITHILTRPARPGGPTQTSHPGGLPSPHQSGLQGGRVGR